MYSDPSLCPLCHQGHLSQLILMDAWSCPACQHLFKKDTHLQRIQALDLSHPLVWQWNGKTWQRDQLDNRSLTVGVIIACFIVVTFPSILIAVASYIFPPLPDSPLAWFPVVWAGLALVFHSLCLCWLLAEAYQIQPYLWLKLWLRRFFSIPSL